MRPKWRKLIWFAPLALLGVALFVFLGGQIVMLLWNWLVPPIFGVRSITFWQALGLLVLCRILFGGFGMSGRRMEAQMTPEDRERFRARIKDRWPFECEKRETKETIEAEKQ